MWLSYIKIHPGFKQDFRELKGAIKSSVTFSKVYNILKWKKEFQASTQSRLFVSPLCCKEFSESCSPSHHLQLCSQGFTDRVKKLRFMYLGSVAPHVDAILKSLLALRLQTNTFVLQGLHQAWHFCVNNTTKHTSTFNLLSVCIGIVWGQHTGPVSTEADNSEFILNTLHYMSISNASCLNHITVFQFSLFVMSKSQLRCVCVCVCVDSRRPLPGGIAAHWCLMSRAQAVWRTGSTKMSALLSFSMFNTSCRRRRGGWRGWGEEDRKTTTGEDIAR